MEKRSMLNEKIQSRFASGSKEEKKKKRRELRAIFSNGVLFKNPMLVGALGIYPMLTACHTLRAALELSVILAAMSIPAGLILCFTGNLVPLWARPALAAGVAAVLYIPASALMEWIFPGAIQSLGMVAGMMVVNSMVLSRSAQYAPDHIPSAVLADTVGCSLGGTLVMCLAAFIREWLIYGDLKLGRISSAYSGEGIAHPFFGFLILGFLAALVQYINRRRAERRSGRKVTRL